MSASLHVASHEIPYVQELLRLGAKQAAFIEAISTPEQLEDMWINENTQEMANRLIEELEDSR